jgi:TRAP-type uncharacterized transport system fused permease subunit
MGEAIVQIAIRFLLSILAIFFLNVAVVGYFMKDLSISTFERIVAGACALLLFYPSSLTDVIGVLIAVAFLAKKWAERRRGTAARRLYTD